MKVESGNKERFLEVLSQEAVGVRQLEGCVRFNIFEDVGDENALLLYEEWQSPESFNAYRTLPAFKAVGEQLFPLMAGKPDSAYYSAEVFS
jgi:quinol monooxygenase YgiN